MIETPIRFGEQESLFGTFTTPLGDQNCDRVAMLMFNAGIVHRVGPHRLNVGIARALSVQGISSIRFDLSGIGDSDRPSSGLPHAEQAIADIKSAMDVMEKESGARRFILFGMCSGAAHSYAAALCDDRIAGIILYDGFRYPTFRSWWNYFVLRARKRLLTGTVLTWITSTVRAFLSSAMRPLTHNGDGLSPSLESFTFFSQKPASRDYAEGLRRILERKLRICMIYAGGGYEYYNYEEQFNDVFVQLGISEGIDVHFLSGGDHTATLTTAQTELINLVVSWTHARAVEI